MRIRPALCIVAGAVAAALAVAAPTHLDARAALAAPPGSDFNGDGHPDIVAGAAGATAGGHAGAGAVSVVPGTSGGIGGTGIVVLDQESPGVSGGSEPGDGFGATLASGDLNGDGVDDAVVAQPGEDLGGDADAGAATLFYGSTAGLGTSTPLRLLSGIRAAGERFGEGLAVGDFDGSGTNDLAVLTVTGIVQPYYDGATATASAPGGRTFAHGTRGRFAGDAGPRTLAAGGFVRAAATDIDGDAHADLAIAYRDSAGLFQFVVIPGSAGGLNYSAATSVEAGGGRSIATGDLNGDGFGDVAVGQPYAADNGSTITGGAVTVYYGNPGGITSGSPRTTIHQGSSGVPGDPVSGDGLGLSIAVGDINGDGFPDVAAGMPRKDAGGPADSGAVLLLSGGSGGLTAAGAVVLSQGLTQVPGVPEAGDRHGAAVTLADTTGDGFADLVAGMPGENSGDGGISFLPGAATMPPATNGTGMLGSGALGLGAASHAGTSMTP